MSKIHPIFRKQLEWYSTHARAGYGQPGECPTQRLLNWGLIIRDKDGWYKITKAGWETLAVEDPAAPTDNTPTEFKDYD
jgi:hypothetical protein